MIELPKKIKEELTKACIQVDSVFNLEDAVVMEIAEGFLIDRGYTYPKWLRLMIEWKQRNVEFTSEEYFLRNRSSHCTDRELKLVKREIDKLHESVREEAYRQSLYVVAYQILKGDDKFDDGLSFEWHSRTASESLEDEKVLNLFVQLLKREIDFWQVGLKPSFKATHAMVVVRLMSPTIDLSKAKRIETKERNFQIMKHNLSLLQKGATVGVIHLPEDQLIYED